MPKINQLKPATSLANTDIMIADTSTGSDTREIAYSDLRTQIQNESKSVFALKGEVASDEQVADAVGDWLTEHVTPTGSAVAIDDTLKIQGAAADAKAAGEIIVVNGTSGNGTRVNITTTDTDIELAEMSDVEELESATDEAFSHIDGAGVLNPSLWEPGFWSTGSGSPGSDARYWRSKDYIDNNIICVTATDNSIGIAVLLYTNANEYVGWIKNGTISKGGTDNARTGYQPKIDLYKIRAKYQEYKIKLVFAKFDTSAFTETGCWDKIKIFEGVDKKIETIEDDYFKLNSSYMLNGAWSPAVLQYSPSRIAVPEKLKVNAEDIIYIDTNVLTGGFAFYDTTENLIAGTWTGWNNYDAYCYKVNTDGYVTFQFKRTDNAAITPADFDADVRIYRGVQRFLAPDKIANIKNLYRGEKMPTKLYGYTSEELLTMQYDSSLTSQDIDIIGNYMFVAFSGDDLIRVYTMDDKSLIASISVDTNHGSSMQFSGEYYDTNDDFPLLYIGGWIDNIIYVVRIDNNFAATIIRKIKISNEQGYYASPCIDGANNILYTYSHSQSAIPNKNEMIIAGWDLNQLNDNGDGTYTPKLLNQCKSPSIGTYQGHKYYGGRIYITSAQNSSPYNPKVNAIDPGSGDILSTINIAGVYNSETEGLCYRIVDNIIEWYVSYWYKIFKINF